MVPPIGTFRSRSVVAAVLCAGGLACNDDSTAPRPVPERAVAVSYCAAVAPTWVAFRDGDGAWTRETPSVAGSATTFRHSFTSNRAAIASLTPVLDGEFSVLRVLYAAPEELSTDGDTTSSDCLTGAFKSLHGTVADSRAWHKARSRYREGKTKVGPNADNHDKNDDADLFS